MKHLFHYWKTLVVTAVILYGSLLREPHFKLPPVENADKWVHGLMYAALGGVLLWDLLRDRQIGWKTGQRTGFAALMSILYGGVIELLQEHFFYPRTGDWFDWLADIIGTGIGCLVIGLFYKYGRRVAK